MKRCIETHFICLLIVVWNKVLKLFNVSCSSGDFVVWSQMVITELYFILSGIGGRTRGKHILYKVSVRNEICSRIFVTIFKRNTTSDKFQIKNIYNAFISRIRYTHNGGFTMRTNCPIVLKKVKEFYLFTNSLRKRKITSFIYLPGLYGIS